MKQFLVYLTFDQVAHNDLAEATKHLDALYSEKLHELTSRLKQVSDGDYAKTRKFIDENLSDFVALSKINEDFLIEEDAE